jgi:hypothetical protein
VNGWTIERAVVLVILVALAVWVVFYVIAPRL